MAEPSDQKPAAEQSGATAADGPPATRTAIAGKPRDAAKDMSGPAVTAPAREVAAPPPDETREERRARALREHEELLMRRQEMKNARLREQIAAIEALDEDDDGPAPARSAEPAAAAQPAVHVAPPALPARPRRRHYAVLLSFIFLVLLPVGAATWYIWTRAADRYASFTSFGIRTEESSSAFELLGSVAQLSGSSGSDTDILYDFIKSQDLVARIDSALDLRTIWSKAGPEADPVFSYHPPGTIEDLTAYWNRMVSVTSDSGTGLINMRVQAFDPDDAQLISRMIFDESSRMINNLSAIAREDATRYAREDLAQAEDRLKAAREALTRFRNLNQLVDPSSSAQAQMGILGSLQQQLATELVELDILRQITAENDPRIQQSERRVAVIEDRIRIERNALGIADPGTGATSSAFADLLGEYERLVVELEFAEQSYTSALAAHDAAVADARRQSRYIAAHIPATLAETSQFPNRLTLTGLVGLFCFLAWAMLVLIGYAIRDRR